MAFLCEIYGYASYCDNSFDADQLKQYLAPDSRFNVYCSSAAESHTLGYVSFAGEGKVTAEEAKDWVQSFEGFLCSVNFFSSIVHVAPEESEPLMFTYFKREKVYKHVREHPQKESWKIPRYSQRAVWAETKRSWLALAAEGVC